MLAAEIHIRSTSPTAQRGRTSLHRTIWPSRRPCHSPSRILRATLHQRMEPPQQSRKRRRAKAADADGAQQENFLFVDSSDQQGTSKPDRASRSFVMQQARKQKSWSTKKFPANSGAKRANKALSSQDEHPPETDSTLSWVHYAPKEDEPRRKGAEVIPFRSGSPHSGKPTTRCRLSFCNGDFCGQSHKAPAHAGPLSYSSPRGVAHLNVSPIGLFDPFDALPVRANPRSCALIDHCKVPSGP